MFMKFILATASACAAVLVGVPTAQADELAMAPRARAAGLGNLPSRGMSMAQVERRFGAPAIKLASAGGDAPKHPPIHRWRYSGYTVYFERNRVIHTVPDAVAIAPLP